MKKLVGALLLAASVATPAVAGDGLYVGAEVGRDHFGVLGGFKINDMFAVEMNYNQFEDHTIQILDWMKIETEAWGLGLSGVGTFPISPVPGLSVFGKAGFEYVEFETTTTTQLSTWDWTTGSRVYYTSTTSTSADDIQFAGSVGAQYDITSNFSARAGVHVKGQADSVFANAIYSF